MARRRRRAQSLSPKQITEGVGYVGENAIPRGVALAALADLFPELGLTTRDAQSIAQGTSPGEGLSAIFGAGQSSRAMRQADADRELEAEVSNANRKAAAYRSIMGDQTTRRAQDYGEMRSQRSDETTRRGQDVTSTTSRRGQDKTAESAASNRAASDERFEKGLKSQQEVQRMRGEQELAKVREQDRLKRQKNEGADPWSVIRDKNATPEQTLNALREDSEFQANLQHLDPQERLMIEAQTMHAIKANKDLPREFHLSQVQLMAQKALAKKGLDMEGKAAPQSPERSAMFPPEEPQMGQNFGYEGAAPVDFSARRQAVAGGPLGGILRKWQDERQAEEAARALQEQAQMPEIMGPPQYPQYGAVAWPPNQYDNMARNLKRNAAYQMP